MELFWRFLGWVKFKYYGVDRNYGDDIWITSANAYVRIVPYSSSGLVGDYSEVFNVYAFVRFVVHRGDRYKQYIR
jgi:hypothetical protein